MEKEITSHLAIIGSLKMGGKEPLLIQSMTSTFTLDTQATVEQIIRIADAGAHLVRITAKDTKDAQNLAEIKKALAERGYHIPLVADIHFNPKAADVAATIVEKVRINPGNYLDKKTGKTNWSEEEYLQDLTNIKERLRGLVEICKKNHTAIRVGVNHGSLSERVVNKFGDTALGMAESAMEFIRIFQELNFNNLVISLKASNVLVMVASNRLLVQKMEDENCIYPLHLGVTEAGDAEDGRIKSAVGIGTLLAEGIGNTIRVSLTEEPEFEIPVAIKIASAAEQNQVKGLFSLENSNFQRRKSWALGSIGNGQAPIVIHSENIKNKIQLQADFVCSQEGFLVDSKKQIIIEPCSLQDVLEAKLLINQKYYLSLTVNDWTSELNEVLQNNQNLLIVLEHHASENTEMIHQLIYQFETENIKNPFVIRWTSILEEKEDLMIHASVALGPLLLAGKLDGIWLESPFHSCIDIAFGILQASRQRVSKTEYIACPSCGRTLFNIQKKLQEIKEETKEFVGLKIAVMGCFVNGPGEMADADYGYVGAGPGKVNIYKGQVLMEKNVLEEKATQALLSLISNSE